MRNEEEFPSSQRDLYEPELTSGDEQQSQRQVNAPKAPKVKRRSMGRTPLAPEAQRSVAKKLKLDSDNGDEPEEEEEERQWSGLQSLVKKLNKANIDTSSSSSVKTHKQKMEQLQDSATVAAVSSVVSKQLDLGERFKCQWWVCYDGEKKKYVGKLMVAQTWTPRLETKNEMGEDHLTFWFRRVQPSVVSKAKLLAALGELDDEDSLEHLGPDSIRDWPSQGLFLPPDAVMGLLEKAEEVFTLLQETTKRLQTVMDHNPRLKAHLEVEASKRTGGRRGF